MMNDEILLTLAAVLYWTFSVVVFVTQMGEIRKFRDGLNILSLSVFWPLFTPIVATFWIGAHVINSPYRLRNYLMEKRQLQEFIKWREAQDKEREHTSD